MCFTPKQSDFEREQAEKDAAARREEHSRPAENTSPRGNGELDREDLERSEEKFAALIGH
jgi:hypothetical protein